jgi:hypothetical protein
MDPEYERILVEGLHKDPVLEKNGEEEDKPHIHVPAAAVSDPMQTETKKKPLKHARTRAEIIRTRNSNIMLFFAVAQSSCTILILLRTFGII